jgi:predicted dinucleotide-binding enzyme
VTDAGNDRGVAPKFDGKLWIDITNPFNERYDDFILPWDTSGAEEIQKRFPRRASVARSRTCGGRCSISRNSTARLSDVYVIGDDAAAKKEFLQLVRGSPFRYVEAGRLANARFVERMTLFAAELGQREDTFPRMNWQLLGEPWSVGKADRLGHLIQREPAAVAPLPVMSRHLRTHF